MQKKHKGQKNIPTLQKINFFHLWPRSNTNWIWLKRNQNYLQKFYFVCSPCAVMFHSSFKKKKTFMRKWRFKAYSYFKVNVNSPNCKVMLNCSVSSSEHFCNFHVFKILSVCTLKAGRNEHSLKLRQQHILPEK